MRNAIRVDEKTYHPVCYDDYQVRFNVYVYCHLILISIYLSQKALAEQPDESVLEQTVVEENNLEEPSIPGLEIIIDDDDDDDQPSPMSQSEIPEIVSLESDESKAVGGEQEESQEALAVEEEDGDDDDVILNEIAPIKIILEDDDEEYNPEEPIENLVKVKREKLDKDDGFVEVSGLVSLQNGGQIKIKAEPVDPGKDFYLKVFFFY